MKMFLVHTPRPTPELWFDEEKAKQDAKSYNDKHQHPPEYDAWVETIETKDEPKKESNHA